MITPLDRSQLHLVRGGAAANAARLQPDPTIHTGERTPLARNVETLVIDAYETGLQHGERQHYTAGWRFGLLCGLLPGMLSGAATALLILWWPA